MKRSPLALFAVAAGFGLSAPALADPPPWAPAHGHRAKQAQVREYHYVYYPAQQVYYAPEQQLWFWMNGGNWQFGVNLPTHYRAYTSSGVQLVLQSDRPYVEHVYVEENYGRPWREKHKHKGKHHKHRDHDD